jgi:hypothetical protein
VIGWTGSPRCQDGLDPFIAHLCDNIAVKTRRLFLDQFVNWCDDPVTRCRAVETGFRTQRGITVARLELWIVETTDAYVPWQVDACRNRADALSRAQLIMKRPDSCGRLREWVVDDGDPRD